MKLTRRRATEEDVAFLLELRHATMDAHLSASGVEASDSEHRARLLHRFDCAEVLLRDGVPAGLLKVSRDGHGWKIIQMQVAPAQQGNGLGTTLLSEVIAEAESAGATLELSVLKANPARALYERLGFVVEGESEHEYHMRYQGPTRGVP